MFKSTEEEEEEDDDKHEEEAVEAGDNSPTDVAGLLHLLLLQLVTTSSSSTTGMSGQSILLSSGQKTVRGVVVIVSNDDDVDKESISLPHFDSLKDVGILLLTISFDVSTDGNREFVDESTTTVDVADFCGDFGLFLLQIFLFQLSPTLPAGRAGTRLDRCGDGFASREVPIREVLLFLFLNNILDTLFISIFRDSNSFCVLTLFALLGLRIDLAEGELQEDESFPLLLMGVGVLLLMDLLFFRFLFLSLLDGEDELEPILLAADAKSPSV